MSRTRIYWISGGVLVLNLIADRLTKILAVEYLKGNDPISFFFNTIVLRYTENTGAFLSLGNNWPETVKVVVLLILPIAACVVAVIFSLFFEPRIGRSVLIATIAAGGLGNLFDRLLRSFHVIDFLNFGIGSLRTGILNVADISVTFGAILLVIFEYQETGRKTKNVG